MIHSVLGGKGKEFAEKIAEEFQAIGQNPHRAGVWSRQGKNGDYYAVIRDTKMPAVISEYAFIDSKDAEAVDTQEKLMAEAKAIARAICKQLGVNFTEQKQEQKQSEQPEHWRTPLLKQLAEKGIIKSPHAPDATVTWAELAAVVLKIMK